MQRGWFGSRKKRDSGGRIEQDSTKGVISCQNLAGKAWKQVEKSLGRIIFPLL